MADVTIYHNPACGTSRNALGLIREARAGRGETLAWADAIEQALRTRAQT